MTERAYTVREIDELRVAVRWFTKHGSTFMPPDDEEIDAVVEQRLRTHILAGHTAQDLYDAGRKEDHWAAIRASELLGPA